jgi:hypothetical protein
MKEVDQRQNSAAASLRYHSKILAQDYSALQFLKVSFVQEFRHLLVHKVLLSHF